MYKSERISKILEILEKKKVVSVADLQKQLFVSDSSLRRDLVELERTGKINRGYGVVELARADNVELSYMFREQEHEAEKKKIAEIASTFLTDNQAIFIDSSSTASFLAPYLSVLHSAIVITNGLRLAVALDNMPAVKTYVTGGRLKSGSGSLLGETSVDYVDNFTADLAFLSCTGITPTHIYMSSESQAILKKKMMAHAEKTVLLADHSKFGARSYYRLARTETLEVVITDEKPGADFVTNLEANEVELLYGN